MSDLDVVVKALAVADQSTLLDFSEANGYQVVAIAEGARSFRRDVATSKWVPGRVLVSSVLDAQTAVLVVRCGATTHAAMRTLVNDARTALEHPSYLLSVSLGGVVEKWLCEPADSTLGDQTGMYDKFELMAVKQTITFTIPRSPILVD